MSDLAPQMPAPGLWHLIELRLEVEPAVHLGVTPSGRRRVVAIRGGSFAGAGMHGIVTCGDDWLTVSDDGTVVQDVRALLRCSDGEALGIRYRGLRHGPPEVMARLDRGEDIDPANYTFFTSPVFEARCDGPYHHLNRAVCLGRGHRTATGVNYSIYRVAGGEG